MLKAYPQRGRLKSAKILLSVKVQSPDLETNDQWADFILSSLLKTNPYTNIAVTIIGPPNGEVRSITKSGLQK